MNFFVSRMINETLQKLHGGHMACQLKYTWTLYHVAGECSEEGH